MLKKNFDSIQLESFLCKYNIKHGGLKRPFQETFIELTRQCIFRCVHCYLRGIHENTGLTYRELCSIIEQLADMKAYRLSLSGGEIFLRKDLFDIIKYAKRKGFYINLSTTAAMINDDIAKELARLYICDVTISLYGMSNKAYKLVTGCSNGFTRVMRGIKALHKRKVPMTIKTVFLRENFCDLEKFKNWENNNNFYHGRKLWLFHPCFSKCFLTAPFSHVMTNSQMEKFVKKFPEEAKPSLIVTPNPHIGLCGEGGKVIMTINAEGEVSPCLAIRSRTTFRDKPLKDIFLHDPLFKAVRKVILKSATKCLHCEYLKFCSPCVAIFSLFSSKIVCRKPPSIMCKYLYPAVRNRMYKKYYLPMEKKMAPGSKPSSTDKKCNI